MPRYEQLKLAQTKKSSSFKYTKAYDMGGGEKKSVIMKPLIIAVTVIIVSALLFGVLNTYSKTISIAINDFFKKDKPEAISLIADPSIITNENNSFLNNLETFRFLIQPENNTNKLEVIVSDTTNRFEASVRENENIISDTPFTNIMPDRITRTSLIPFYNNPDIVREEIIKEEISKQTNILKTNNSEMINTIVATTVTNYKNKNTHTNIFNNIDIAKSFNNIDILKKETLGFNDIDFDKLNNITTTENNNRDNNVVAENSTENKSADIKTPSTTVTKKAQTTVSTKTPQTKTAVSSKTSSGEQKTSAKKEEIINATEFSEILKPKDKSTVITKTMKPASSSYSYTPKTPTITRDDEEKVYKEAQKDKIATVKREETKKSPSAVTTVIKKENTVVVNPKKEYIAQNTYNPQAVVKKYYNEKINEEKALTKEEKIKTTETAILEKNNTTNTLSPKIQTALPLQQDKNISVNTKENTEKQIKESVLPKNINESKTQTKTENISVNTKESTEINNSAVPQNTVTRNDLISKTNTMLNENNNSQITSSVTKPVEENGIVYPSVTQTPASIVSRDINSQNSYMPAISSSISRPNQISAKRGVFLVEYNENDGTITLVFKERIFENKNPTLEEVIFSLLQGASDKENRANIISCISKEAKLLDIFRDDNILYLNFNDAFEYNPLGSEGMIVQLYQIVYTATQFEGIDSVVFLINGEFNNTIGSEGYIVNKPFSRLERNEIIKSAE